MHIVFDPSAPISNEISFDDFLKVDIRVGQVLKCEPYPKANKPSYIFEIDFGQTIGKKNSIAQLTDLYEAKHLVGKQILAVVNFPPRQIASAMSEVLILGCANESHGISLCNPEHLVPNGSRLT